VVVLLCGCAGEPPSRSLAADLLTRERLVYEARSRDLDAAIRLVDETRTQLAAACRTVADARVQALRARVDRAEQALLARVEAGARGLIAEARAAGVATADGDLARQAQAAAREAEAQRTRLAERPNDARLAARAAAAETRAAELERRRLAAVREDGRAFADRVEAARRTGRARIAEGIAGVRSAIDALPAEPCVDGAAVDPAAPARRRALFAALHDAQVAGLAALSAGGAEATRPAAPDAEAARDALDTAWAPALADSLLAPSFMAALSRASERLDAREAAIARAIDAALEELERMLTAPT